MGIEVIQPHNVVIPTTRVEIVVTPNTNFVKGEILIGSTTNLGHGLNRVLAKRNLSGSLATNNNHWSYWGTLDGVYQYNNEHSCK
jgi:hypothetical protein